MARADLVQRLAQVGHGGGGRFEQRPRIVDERQRAAFRAPALVHHALRGKHVLAKHVLARVAGEADEVEVGDVRPLVVEVGERLVEQVLLRGEHRLRRRIRKARIGALRPTAPSTTNRSARSPTRTRSARSARARPPARATSARRATAASASATAARRQREGPHDHHRVERGPMRSPRPGWRRTRRPARRAATCSSGKPASTSTGSASTNARCPNASASTAAVSSSRPAPKISLPRPNHVK